MPFAESGAAVLWSRQFMRDAGNVLRHAVDSSQGIVRIVYILSGSWVDTFAPTRPRFASPAVRSFVNGEDIRRLEMRPDCYDDWDSAIVMEEPWKGVSASVIVFRFEGLKQLGKMMGQSKEVADCFMGMTEEV